MPYRNGKQYATEMRRCQYCKQRVAVGSGIPCCSARMQVSTMNNGTAAHGRINPHKGANKAHSGKAHGKRYWSQNAGFILIERPEKPLSEEARIKGRQVKGWQKRAA